jgi:hypothetical protein
VCSAPLTLSDWRLGAQTVDTSNQRLVHLPGCCRTELPKDCNDECDMCLSTKQWELWASHLLFLFLFLLQNSLHTTMDARGPAIDVFNFGGGRCRTCSQHPAGAPPSTSPTLVVAAAGPAANTPQGVRHQRLQLRWWPLPDLPPAPASGPAIDVSLNLGPASSTPEGARH